MIGKANVGGENLTAELTAQETIIQNMAESLIGKTTGANATADKILEGFSAYVGQQLLQGTFKPMTGINFGEVTKTTAGATLSIEHGLGTTPKRFYLIEKTLNSYDATAITMWGYPYKYNDTYTDAIFTYAKNGSLTGRSRHYTEFANAETVTADASVSSQNLAQTTFIWIAIA